MSFQHMEFWYLWKKAFFHILLGKEIKYREIVITTFITFFFTVSAQLKFIETFISAGDWILYKVESNTSHKEQGKKKKQQQIYLISCF